VKYLPTNTLAHLKACPQTRLHELGGLAVGVLSKNTKVYKDGCSNGTIDVVTPDVEAVKFYALNHCVSIIQKMFTLNEPLPEWAEGVVKQYEAEVVAQSERLIQYMLCITTREARHLKSPSISLSKNVTDKFGIDIWTFINANRGGHESSAMTNMCNSPPNCTLRQYLGGLSWVFDHGSWSGGYGGKPWGQITATLLAAIDGKITFEMMVDTAYTLAHNNGPMFNKGMMYHHHTPSFISVLDIQRSGQIPELLLDKETWVSFSLPEYARQMVQVVNQACPDNFGEFVDWFKVEAMGSVGSYSSNKAKQQKLHPKENPMVFMGKPAKQVGEFQVFPGQGIPIFERVPA